ncbi:MAG: ferritin-like domain-containing protein, partial [Nannocystaceae bacterium]|nr:ferritin-like domain-containing protein [Nannocystaceae bacterium]
MPADVERLFRTIAPALVLLAGCDATEAEPKVGAVVATPIDVGAGAARVNAADEGAAKLELPPDVGVVAPVDEKPAQEVPVVKTPVVKTPKAIPEPEPMRKPPRATCPSGTWCTDKASAKKHAIGRTKYSLGCAENISSSAKGLTGPSPSGRLRGLDKAQTKAKRAEGIKDACCYGWYRSCPGGRPLLDDAGTPVVASFEPGSASAWSCERASLPASPQARAFAARAWLDDAAMEHASVASFGRVALELLSLGAPPELVEGAHLAALDEIRHAKTCLSLARACGAGALEPGCLAPVPQRSAQLARFAADTFIEGCVGESIAALVVTRAAAGAEDPTVREALEEIAADEARHAALAWRMVSWAVDRGGAPVREAVL